MKAKLHLYDEAKLMPPPPEKGIWVDCEKHKNYTVQAADNCVILVKSTQRLLPMDPKKKKRAYLVYVQSTPTSKGYNGLTVEGNMINSLQVVQIGVELDCSFAVDGDTLILDFRGAEGPVSIHFADTKWFAVNLYNRMHIPAIPFTVCV